MGGRRRGGGFKGAQGPPEDSIAKGLELVSGQSR